MPHGQKIDKSGQKFLLVLFFHSDDHGRFQAKFDPHRRELVVNGRFKLNILGHSASGHFH